MQMQSRRSGQRRYTEQLARESLKEGLSVCIVQFWFRVRTITGIWWERMKMDNDHTDCSRIAIWVIDSLLKISASESSYNQSPEEGLAILATPHEGFSRILCQIILHRFTVAPKSPIFWRELRTHLLRRRNFAHGLLPFEGIWIEWKKMALFVEALITACPELSAVPISIADTLKKAEASGSINPIGFG